MAFFSPLKKIKPDAQPEKEIPELRARAEEAEAKSRRLESILNSMSEGLGVLDPDLKISYANPRLCSLFGFDSGTAKINFPDVPLLSFSRSAELETAAKQVLATGRPSELIVKRYALGIEQHLQIFIAPLDTAGQGAVIVVGDISRLARLEQVRKDFVANVSHELRTPIQVVKGFAENILTAPQDNVEQIRRFAEIINKNAQTMENITSDLLSLVSLEDESSGQRLPMEETALAPLIAEAVAMVEIAAGKKDISIEVNCPPDLSARLYGPLIIQALVNLLDNAIKYSGSGSRIRVFAFIEGKQLVIEVKDRGIGIPSEHMGRIFERFYRVDKAHSRDANGGVSGTGLGLAIVRHIALLHSGNAELESHAGEGSLFRLRLPCLL